MTDLKQPVRWLSLLGLLASMLSASRASAQECVPQCRSGYVCASGACVSACNPACTAGQSCVNGDCVASGPPPAAGPPQSYPPAGPPPAGQPPPGQPPAYYPPPGQQPQYAPAPPPAPEPEPHGSGGAYTHDGFFLQFGLGVGFVTGTAEAEFYDIDVGGIAQLGHLAIGGSPVPGLVLGGGVFGTNVPTTKYETDFGGETYKEDGDLSSASLIAGFATYYLEPLQQFFLTGGLGAALLSTGKADGVPETSGNGLGALVGVGFESFISEQWSLGGMLRVIYLSAELETDDGDKSDFKGWVPGLMMVGTYH